MRVLIFGGTRFMGGYLIRSLIKIGADITIANRGTREPIAGVTNLVCDRSHPKALEQFVDSEFDVIIDFSAYSSQWIAEVGPVFANKISRYIFISSGAVYANSSVFPITEEFPVGLPHPFQVYAAEKLKSEQLLVQHSRDGFFQTVSCRLPFVMGPENYEDRESFVFSRLLRGDPILLSNGGTSIHSFIYAGDVAEALLAIIAADKKVDQQKFNIAILEAITSLGFVEMAAAICKNTPNIVSFDPEKFGLKVDDFNLKNLTFPFPAINSYLGSSKLEQFTGFSPKYDLPKMLEIYYKWWISRSDLAPKRYPLEQEILKSLSKI